ncbi:MAG: radical SAM protein [Candidatus Thermoplasmatota archaeon]|nr:radical SAM protein [Candidatus Thermoplasmatota archaeon]
MSKVANGTPRGKKKSRRGKTFYINCSGCARSGMNAEKIKNYLIKNDLIMVDAVERADLILMLTCGLPTSTPHELKVIQEYKKLKGEIIICGCLPAMEPERLAEVFDGRTVITKELERIDEIFPDLRYKFKDMDDTNRLFTEGHYHQYSRDAKIPITALFLESFAYFVRGLQRIVLNVIEYEVKMPFLERTGLPRLIEVDPDGYSIRISSGCLGNCSYCAIKDAIGRLRSKSPDDILEEIRIAISKGEYRISFVSDDAGAYGLDIGTNLVSLLKRVLEEDERIQIEYLQDVHPQYLCRFGDEFIELVRTGRIKSLQTAVQSGSERVLKLMNRPLDVEEYKTIIKKMKKAYPAIRIRTQMIVGFPSETEKDFEETVRLLRDCHFDQTDAYQYHEYSSCDSKKIFPKIPKETMEERQRILLDMGRPRMIIFSRINIKRVLQQIAFMLGLWKEPKY